MNSNGATNGKGKFLWLSFWRAMDFAFMVMASVGLASFYAGFVTGH